MTAIEFLKQNPFPALHVKPLTKEVEVDELADYLQSYADQKISASPSIAIISRLVNAFSFDKGREGEDLAEQNSALKEAQAFLDKMNVGK